MSKEDINDIKVEISLKDLVELQEKAKYYYMLLSENEELRKENFKLKEK